MAKTYKKQPWLYSSGGDVVPADRTVRIAASQTYIASSPVYVSSAGTCKLEATATGTDDSVSGFANVAASTALAINTSIRITSITADQLWYIYLSNGAADIVASAAFLGNAYGYNVQTTPATEKGYMTLDVANGNATMVVVDLAANLDPSTYSTSDTQGLVIARFLPAVINEIKA